MYYHSIVIAPRAVVEPKVLVGALLRKEGHSRAALRACFENRLKPVVGHELFLEYEDVLGRARLFTKCPLSARERRRFVESFLSICEWVRVYYLWQPNLPDEGDNHIVELAVAGGAPIIVTNNGSDFAGWDLRFPDLRILGPKDVVKEVA